MTTPNSSDLLDVIETQDSIIEKLMLAMFDLEEYLTETLGQGAEFGMDWLASYAGLDEGQVAYLQTFGQRFTGPF